MSTRDELEDREQRRMARRDLEEWEPEDDNESFALDALAERDRMSNLDEINDDLVRRRDVLNMLEHSDNPVYFEVHMRQLKELPGITVADSLRTEERFPVSRNIVFAWDGRPVDWDRVLWKWGVEPTLRPLTAVVLTVKPEDYGAKFLLLGPEGIGPRIDAARAACESAGVQFVTAGGTLCL